MVSESELTTAVVWLVVHSQFCRKMTPFWKQKTNEIPKVEEKIWRKKKRLIIESHRVEIRRRVEECLWVSSISFCSNFVASWKEEALQRCFELRVLFNINYLEKKKKKRTRTWNRFIKWFWGPFVGWLGPRPRVIHYKFICALKLAS